MNNEIIVNYVAGSCYSIEVGDYFLVFDYAKGILNVPDDKKTIFFATSKEKTSYSPEILKVAGMEKFTYVLTTDIAYTRGDNNVIYLKDNKLSIESLKDLYKSNNVNFIEKNTYYRLNKDIDIYTYSYKGKGISFMLRVEDFTIFYGGFDFLGKNDISNQDISTYLYEMYEVYDGVDLGFFPILRADGSNNFSRAKSFIEVLGPQIFFPTNFREDRKICKEFASYKSYEDTDIRWANEANQEFVIDWD